MKIETEKRREVVKQKWEEGEVEEEGPVKQQKKEKVTFWFFSLKV